LCKKISLANKLSKHQSIPTTNKIPEENSNEPLAVVVAQSSSLALKQAPTKTSNECITAFPDARLLKLSQEVRNAAL